MQSVEEKNLHDYVVARTCLVTVLLYLSVHVFYLAMFMITDTFFMIVLNIISILIYLLFFVLVKKGKYYIYALCCGFEIITFMSISTVVCGFVAGFQLNIIGLCIVSFFTVYFNSQRRDVTRAIVWTIWSVVIYLGLHFYMSFNDPYYALDKWLIVTLYAFHSISAFGFVVSYLLIFLKYAMDLEDRIKMESRTDKLTQIHNRYDLYNYLDSIKDKNGYALAIFDIDDFKTINDTYGHVYGDYVLKTIARLADDNNDFFVSRYGGEEFVVIVKLEDDSEDVFDLIDSIRKMIDEYSFSFEGIDTHVTISCGIAKYTGEISIDEWINLADNKLYECKNSGKNKTLML